MDWSEDTGLRDGLRSLPVPDHGPDYLRRRDEALAAVAEPMHNGDTSTHGSARLRVRSRWRRPVVGMTAAFAGVLADRCGEILSRFFQQQRRLGKK